MPIVEAEPVKWQEQRVCSLLLWQQNIYNNLIWLSLKAEREVLLDKVGFDLPLHATAHSICCLITHLKVKTEHVTKKDGGLPNTWTQMRKVAGLNPGHSMEEFCATEA